MTREKGYTHADVNTQLEDLTSLIKHTQEIEQGFKSVIQSLRNQYVNPAIYHIDPSIDVNKAHLQEILDSSDMHIRTFLAAPLNRKAVIVFIESMADQKIINRDVIEKLIVLPLSGLANINSDANVIDILENRLLTAASLSTVTDMNQAVKRILSGDTALFIDNETTAVIIATRDLKNREITEPVTESDVRGPRDGFTEDLRTNITLLRRRVRNPNLIVWRRTVGTHTEIDTAIVYFRGITNFQFVTEMEERLNRINSDLSSSSSLQSIIEDHPYSPFPLIITTERPDKFVAAIMEGKVGVIVDGTPYCLLAPTTIFDFFKAGDDYYEKWIPAFLIRFSRYFAAFFAMAMPAIYVAITSFHPALLPTPLALTIAISREGVPFPTFLETLIMVIILEILQEAGIRMPKTIGPAVSIVGGLVIGDSAVRAGLVSSPLIIITAFTAIASFSIAKYQIGLPLRFLRVPLMIAASSFGMVGVMLGLMAIATHLSILESFGVPYLAPIVPKNIYALSDLKDTVAISSPASFSKRPTYLNPEDSKRQGDDVFTKESGTS